MYERKFYNVTLGIFLSGHRVCRHLEKRLYTCFHLNVCFVCRCMYLFIDALLMLLLWMRLQHSRNKHILDILCLFANCIMIQLSLFISRWDYIALIDLWAGEIVCPLPSGYSTKLTGVKKGYIMLPKRYFHDNGWWCGLLFYIPVELYETT